LYKAAHNQTDFDYTDISTLSETGKCACLLCQRQFKSEAILQKHVAQSELHKARLFLLWVHSEQSTDLVSFYASHALLFAWHIQTNLANADVVMAGKRRKIAASDAEYRDRAAERRKAFNQPEKPSWHELQGAEKRRRFDGPEAPDVNIPAAPPGQDQSNVGNQLLSKMGWKAGMGLGDGGRVEPIKVQQFAERAGLGSGTGVTVGENRPQSGNGIVGQNHKYG
jgi:RNA-binding protein 5/10